MSDQTHLMHDMNDSDLQITGYTLIRCDGPGNVPSGGVCVSYKSDLPSPPKPDFLR